MTKIFLGKVAFTDAGAYASGTSYDRFDFITTDDSCYLSVKDENKGHALTDTAWWKCIARGTQATEAAKTALQEANKAIEATRNAISAAGLANINAQEAKKQAGLAGQASDDALAAAVEAEAMISEGNAQIASMRAAEQSLMSQALLAPTSMELRYVKRVTLGNTVSQRIAVSLFPAYVLPNVIFQQAFYSGDALYVDPRGNLTVRKTGTATIHVIPSHNTSLAQTIVIEVTAPVIRKAGSVMRLLSGSRIRKV
ncbi:hypothetical protein [Parabacteroides distasonis]|uniref:hypothetical protein n=1 Tax=Parabacteroides distasonis TaxID=823 RepID=UPI00321A083A